MPSEVTYVLLDPASADKQYGLALPLVRQNEDRTERYITVFDSFFKAVDYSESIDLPTVDGCYAISELKPEPLMRLCFAASGVGVNCIFEIEENDSGRLENLTEYTGKLGVPATPDIMDSTFEPLRIAGYFSEGGPAI